MVSPLFTRASHKPATFITDLIIAAATAAALFWVFVANI